MSRMKRLWWKEARQVWPIWAFLAVAALATQACLAWIWGGRIEPGTHVVTGFVATSIYLFLIAAAAFAGEREAGTLAMLDAIPVDRMRVWTAKTSFALVTTTILGLLLWVASLAYEPTFEAWWRSGRVAALWCLTGLGWGLLWSSIVSNALFAALAGMGSLSLSLIALVNLQESSSTFRAIPSLLGLFVLTTAASAWLFRRDGRPLPGAGEGRPAAALASSPVASPVVAEPRVRWAWLYSLAPLAWSTWRQARAESWMLGSLALGVALAWASEVHILSLLGLAGTALLAGVLAFSGENRGGRRLLLRNGARPGLVWLVKAAAWGVVAFVFCTLGALPILREPNTWGPIRGGLEPSYEGVAAAYGLLASVFAVALVCGMVFRRGIVAGTIATVAALVVIGPAAGLASAGLLSPSRLLFIAPAILAVGWAWSGPWLLDRPGWGRWVRLASYSALVPALLVPAYIADRTSGLPTLTPEQAEEIFESARIGLKVPEADNAAPLYVRAERELQGLPKPPGDEGPDLPVRDFVILPDWAPTDPRLREWMDRHEPVLATLREGARKPECRYRDLGSATLFDPYSEPHPLVLTTPLINSALIRLGQGDLDGSWGDIESLQRMAIQYSHTYSWSAPQVAQLANAATMVWAADPRQTVDSLERGWRALQGLPPQAGPAERLRLEARVFHNSIDIPRAELSERVFQYWSFPRGRESFTAKLGVDLLTTPWEVDRLRKVYDMVAAIRIDWIRRSRDPYATLEPSTGSRFPDDPRWRCGPFGPHPNLDEVSLPEHVVRAIGETPFLRLMPLGFATGQEVQSEAFRRAMALVFRLRIWQAKHDGALPNSLEALRPSRDAEDDSVEAFERDLRDVYGFAPFGYLPSQGQSLLPLGASNQVLGGDEDGPKKLLRPTDGCWLLYSVGRDYVDDRARKNVDPGGKGDWIFPLKDGVKPPAAKP